MRAALGELEPSLDGRFREGLFYPDEGHVEPRRVLPELHARILQGRRQDRIRQRRRYCEMLEGIVIDCRGLGARDSEPELRGVKGEMIIVETDEVELSRPVRLIHPRWPLYVIPRGDNRFMLGATSIEAEDIRRQRALGAGAAGRGLRRAPGLCRGAHPRIRRRAAPGLPRQFAAHRHRQDRFR